MLVAALLRHGRIVQGTCITGSLCGDGRGTFLGAAWGPFADVRKVWMEFFESKPYKANAFGIAGELSLPVGTRCLCSEPLPSKMIICIA